MLQCVAVCCSVMCCDVLQSEVAETHVYLCCSALQSIAVCCSVLCCDVPQSELADAHVYPSSGNKLPQTFVIGRVCVCMSIDVCVFFRDTRCAWCARILRGEKKSE